MLVINNDIYNLLQTNMFKLLDFNKRKSFMLASFKGSHGFVIL